MIRPFILFSLIGFLAGCSSLVEVSLSPQEKQWIDNAGGSQVMASQLRHGVIVGPTTSTFDTGNGLDLIVGVKHNGGPAFSFSSRYVGVSMGGEPIQVLGYEELAKEAEKSRNLRNFGVALQQLGNSMGTNTAGYSTSTFQGNTQGYAYTPGGAVQIQGMTTGTITTYDPVAAARADAQFQENIRRQQININADFDKQMSALQNALKPQLVSPGGAAGGIVRLRGIRPSSSGNILKVVVNAQGELHEFQLQVKPAP